MQNIFKIKCQYPIFKKRFKQFSSTQFMNDRILQSSLERVTNLMTPVTQKETQQPSDVSSLEPESEGFHSPCPRVNDEKIPRKQKK